MFVQLILLVSVLFQANYAQNSNGLFKVECPTINNNVIKTADLSLEMGDEYTKATIKFRLSRSLQPSELPLRLNARISFSLDTSDEDMDIKFFFPEDDSEGIVDCKKDKKSKCFEFCSGSSNPLIKLEDIAGKSKMKTLESLIPNTGITLDKKIEFKQFPSKCENFNDKTDYQVIVTFPTETTKLAEEFIIGMVLEAFGKKPKSDDYQAIGCIGLRKKLLPLKEGTSSLTIRFQNGN